MWRCYLLKSLRDFNKSNPTILSGSRQRERLLSYNPEKLRKQLSGGFGTIGLLIERWITNPDVPRSVSL
jgi:hypothetical protein